MNQKIDALIARMARAVEGRQINIMEVCGTHTVSLFRTGVKGMLPEGVRLISGPGCPVCVTSQAYLDVATTLAKRPEVIIATYGDMIRVPGRDGSLAQARAAGARVEVVYSARDALRLAQENPKSEVVFLAVGFETTAPATALTIFEAKAKGIKNFSCLLSHKLVMPALRAVLGSPDAPAGNIDGFLCPGHVSVVIGVESYRPIVEDYKKPCVVAGFEPEGMLEGVTLLVEAVASGELVLENVYSVAVRAEGNPHAQRILEQVFRPSDEIWRAMGTIPGSGLGLSPDYRAFDALERFGLAFGEDYEPAGCRCGEVIQGLLDPPQCPLFRKTCTPMKPIGPCMVSSEGTCAAWYKYAK